MVDKISADDRAELGASLVLLAPPKQTKEVVKDVKVLVGDNPAIEKKILSALLTYAKEQTIQVTLPGSSMNTLVTEDGDLGGGKFLCPRLHQSFRLDVFTHVVDDVSPLPPDDGDGGSVKLEPWRLAIEEALTHYMGQNFPHGAVSVFAPCKSKTNCIVIFIESSFQKTRLSGRWRSRWTVNVPGEIKGGTCKVSGEIRIQTHMFEEGNVQLLSSKTFEFDVEAKSPESLGQDLCKKITLCDANYQTAIGKSLDDMSTKSVKALRRQLPMSRDKMDWNKLASYQVGNELTRLSSSIGAAASSAT
ncbi:unnamed protein product [Hymenolepis diminuta]|uniref:F-actin-capping protein subunit alpha n=1 Tax=Hymenolepis diminuta TaxID=6216 RepID=A0A0R3SCA1_HYMDI|nr:unnamed protein product [Hymenolepis diminuta]VUZ51532.1 unnamed protein product [Hymenolepis diminuta]